MFDTTKQNISLHAANSYKDGEQDQQTVVKEYLTTAADGKRCKTKVHNRPMILHNARGMQPYTATMKTLAGVMP